MHPKQFAFDKGLGFDMKYGLSDQFTLDATVNPDFGQVEADPAVLNLTTFETFFPEKRAFFVEGTQIFQFPTFGDFAPGLFYSRRIGHGLSSDDIDIPNGGKIISAPNAVTILGAAKVSGKTESGFSLGVLDAVTKKEIAVVENASGKRSEQLLEPQGNFSVLRMKQDLENNSNVGMMLTNVTKQQKFPGSLAAFDWNIRYKENNYLFDGFFSSTRTAKDTSQLQNGWEGRIQYSKIGGEHWTWFTGTSSASKNFDANDLGFSFRGNDFAVFSGSTYKEEMPADWYRAYYFNAFFFFYNDQNGTNLDRQPLVNGRFQFLNYWTLGAKYEMNFGKYDDRETRDNGLYEKPKESAIGMSVESDNRGNVLGSFGVEKRWNDKKMKSTGVESGIEFRPLDWMEWNFRSAFRLTNDKEAFVANLDSSGVQNGTTTIFGDRDTREYNFTLRSTITFTRDFTVQLYSQLFFAKGHFDNFLVPRHNYRCNRCRRRNCLWPKLHILC